MPDIVFLSDFGLSDWFVPVMKGVAHSIAPQAGLIDLSHEIQPGAIQQAGFVLAQAAPWFCKGTIFCVVVDPGVGTPRRALACSDGERFYVAPDNGVLSGVARAAGKRWRCRVITKAQQALEQDNATFHGRDVFAPAAAQLARIPDLKRMGPAYANPIILPDPAPQPTGINSWRGGVIHVDHFGNAITSYHRDRAPFGPQIPTEVKARIDLVDVHLRGVHHTYGDVAPGKVLAYWGSSGYLEIGINQGNAAERHKIRVGDPVLVALPS